MKTRFSVLCMLLVGVMLVGCGKNRGAQVVGSDGEGAFVRPLSKPASADPTTAAAEATTVVYSTVGPETFTVPDGVTSLSVVAVGGGGAGTIFSTLFGPPNAGATGGAGAMVTATLSVTPGQVLDLFVGAGAVGPNWSVGGGGSTNISSGGVSLVIAGGGGGAGQYADGGSGGGPGGAGGDGSGATNTGKYKNNSGTGGTGGAGGIGGAGGGGNHPPLGTAGGNGNGGLGGLPGASTPIVDGGGGHGGWYGSGGGGGYGGGGGGGTVSGGGAGGSLGPAGATFAPANNGGPMWQDGAGGSGGDGSIEITFEEITDPTSVGECKNGGWQDFGFRNQGQCIRFVNTGKDSR